MRDSVSVSCNASRCLKSRRLFVLRGVRVFQHAHPRQRGEGQAQQLELLGFQIGRLCGKPGDVPAWARQARDEPAAHRIRIGRHHDRNRRRRVPRGRDGQAARDDDVHGGANQLCNEGGQTIEVALRVAIVDQDIRSGRPAQVAEPCFEPFALAKGIAWRRLSRREDTDTRHARPLRIRKERRHREERDQQDDRENK